VFDIRELPPVSSTFYKFNPDEITVHIGDITSSNDISKAIVSAKPSVIVHSASPIHGLGPALYYKVNVEGTQTLINCAKYLGVKALVYTSSAGVIFNGNDLFNADESVPYPKKALDAYNSTKALGEDMVLKANCKEFKTTCIRPAGIFGPGDRQMIPQLRLAGQRNQYRFQLGDNLNLFDITYVGNVAYAHLLAAKLILEDETSSKVAGETFHVTNDSPIYFWSIGRLVWKCDGYISERPIVIPRSVGVVLGYLSEFACKIIGKEPSLTPFRVRTSCATRYYDITKAKTILGYEPQVGLERGVELTLQSMDEK
jgi:sterol-4alpha-carboxylate 3-dehydrogenase (decarboxylating)